MKLTTDEGEVYFTRYTFNDTDSRSSINPIGGVIVGDDTVDLYGGYEVYYEIANGNGIPINQFSNLSYDFDGTSKASVKLCLYEELDSMMSTLCPTRCVSPRDGNSFQLGPMFHYREVVVKYISFKQASAMTDLDSVSSLSDLLPQSRFEALRITSVAREGPISDGQCHDPHARLVYVRSTSRNTIEEACKCMDGYVSSSTTKKILGRFDTCVSCMPEYLPLCPSDSVPLLAAYSSGVCSPTMGILIMNDEFGPRAEIKADLIVPSNADTQIFSGGSVLSSSGRGISLHGDVMATYLLKQDVPIQGDARIQFNFTLPQYSATNHFEYFTAVCLSKYPISWSRGSQPTNQICVQISDSSKPVPAFVPTDTDSSRWLIPFSILSGKYSIQSSRGDTSNTGMIATGSDQDPWWEIDLEGQFRIQQITIHRDSPRAAGSLGNFTLALYQTACSGTRSGGGSLGYVKVMEESDQDVIAIQIPTSQKYSCIRVQRNGAEESILSFYKMEVDEYIVGPLRSFDIPIGRMVTPTSENDGIIGMRYITFINYSDDATWTGDTRAYFDGVRLMYSDVSWFEDTSHPSLSSEPSLRPSLSMRPSLLPSEDPTIGPSDHPSDDPSIGPRDHPSDDPSLGPVN